VASKRSLSAKNLQALGVERLSELLIEVSAGNAEMKRRLRMELAGAESPLALAGEIRKRLASLEKSKSFVSRRRIKSLASDLDSQRKIIVEQLSQADAKEACDVLLQFMTLSKSIFERCNDSKGIIMRIFHDACKDLGSIVVQAKLDPINLADRVYDLLISNHYGQYNDLIKIMVPALGNTGLEQLKQRMIELSKISIGRPPDAERIEIAWSSSGSIYADAIEERLRVNTARCALQDVADAQNDVDSFIAQYSDRLCRQPQIAAEIARRLLSADRAHEALAILDEVEDQQDDNRTRPDLKWEDARIDALQALGRADEVQLIRWDCFKRYLSSKHLRAYLKRLPDFDDIEAEDKALNYAVEFSDHLSALSFLVSWPSLERAAHLVINHIDDLDGDHYDILTEAADALAGRHPLASTLLLRKMIDFTLSHARTKRYRYAARHLLNCASLSLEIADFASVEPHDIYEARLRREYARKAAFWKKVH